jgi:competence ComEA-like helix-hairpin-helix protein
MNQDERRALWLGTGVLVLASLLRLGWEMRSSEPFLPPDTSAYETLIPGVDSLLVAEARRRTPLAPGERIDPNVADAVELSRLPGVGPALADRILAFREVEGWIDGADALVEVPGIGPATLDRLRPLLLFGPRPPGRRAVGAGSSGSYLDSRLDLNHASARELESLSGIGPALAARIVADREARGAFQSVEELVRVPGIGPALVERLRGRVFIR